MREGRQCEKIRRCSMRRRQDRGEIEIERERERRGEGTGAVGEGGTQQQKERVWKREGSGG